ncbi:hypothetical protein ACF0H5_004556 [Mactra antiquata]
MIKTNLIKFKTRIPAIPVMKKDEKYTLIGGFNILKAVKAAYHETSDHCFNNINVKVYENLELYDILRISASFQSSQRSKAVTFQDRVRLIRKVYMCDETNWKDKAKEALELLDCKEMLLRRMNKIRFQEYSLDENDREEMFVEIKIQKKEQIFHQNVKKS